MQATQSPFQKQEVRFNRTDRPEFIKDLRKRVADYFEENGISRSANASMKIKTLFMVLLYFIPLGLMLSGLVAGLWPVLGMWTIMGFGMAGIGASVMHDGNHASYSRSKFVNKAMGLMSNIVGGYHVNWIIQHNVLHHTFTNVEGHDEDLEAGVMRLAPGQERKWFNRFQAFYAPIFYSLMTLNWLILKDFQQAKRFSKRGLMAKQGLTYKQALSQVILSKLVYFTVLLALPMYFVDLPWYQILLGFLIMHFICGQIMSLVFQAAHVVGETKFYTPEEDGSLENNWAIHQLLSTANFSRKGNGFSWLIGGLSNQIEHHLFPNICHIHYRDIAPIVRKTAEDHGLPYFQHSTFFGALRSHFVLLHDLGTGSYEQKQAIAP